MGEGLGEGVMYLVIGNCFEGVAWVFVECRVGEGDDCVSEGRRQVLWVGRVEGDVTASGIFGGEGIEDVLASAVVDAGRLQEQSVGRVEQNRQGLDRGQITSEVDIGKRTTKDERGNAQRDRHANTEEEVAPTRSVGMLTGKPPFTPRTQDGEDGWHGASIQAVGKVVRFRNSF